MKKIQPYATLITLLILLVLNSANALPGAINGNNPDEDNNSSEKASKDTVPAVVLYGENFLLEQGGSLEKDAVISFRDSLLSLTPPPFEIIDQINLYLNIQSMSDMEIVQLIDSLFEVEKIPYSLINQINTFISNRPVKEEDDLFAITDTSDYPAHCFYGQWSTDIPNPYPADLCKEDSVVHLLLQGREKEDQYVPPVVNVVTSNFGWRDGRNHNGTDIDLEVWDTVVTAFSGMVRVARFYGGYGRVVVVRHFNGLETLYAHLHRIKVKPGQLVKAGELIGLGGSSGNSSGSHLHFECRFKGVPINPMNLICFEKNQLYNDTLVIRKTRWGYAAYPMGTKFHIVKKGDSLHDISIKYGTSIGNLRQLNGIRRNQYLQVGQQIRII